MKLDRIEIRHIKMQLVAPFETSFGVETDEEHIVVRVDAEGLTGWGKARWHRTLLLIRNHANSLAHP